MRHCDALAKSRIQNPFALLDFQFHAYRLEAHRVNPLIRHVYLSFAFVGRRQSFRASGGVMVLQIALILKPLRYSMAAVSRASGVSARNPISGLPNVKPLT